MPQNQDQNLISLIRNAPYLMEPEKQYLVEKIPIMGPLDKLKTKKSLTENTTPDLIVEFRPTREEFLKSEKPKEAKPNALQAKILGQKPKPKQIVAFSILGQPHYLGSPSPRPQPVRPIPSTKLEEIVELFHLGSLTPDHVSFTINENGEQAIRAFLQRIETKMSTLPDMYQKRNVLALFLSSPLFKLYLNTGITALKHPEIKPKSTILNTMQKIDRRFLNRNQFEYAAMLSSGLRSMAGL